MAIIAGIIIAYLLGSLNMAIIIAKVMNLPDPRSEGSGNPGATNMLRNAGKKEAAMVLVGDCVKGLIAVLIARIFGVQGFMLGIVALAAVVGHVFPLYFRFKGGKGVATTMGAFLALSLWLGVISIAVWVIVAFIWKYASLASLSAVGAGLIVSLFIGHFAFFLPVLLIAALVAWKHLDNINRLKDGTETKMEF